LTDIGSAHTRSEPGALATVGEIPLCVPHLGGNERLYLNRCIETNWVSSVGAFVDEFEAAVATYVGVGHGIAVSTGTAALHVALQLVGVRPDDEVVVPSLTFIAPANAVRYVGAFPVFVDVEPRWGQLDVARVEEFLRCDCARVRDGVIDRRTGRRVAALLPVHILGHPVDLDPLLAVAREFELPVVEDAAEAFGGHYRSRPLGRDGTVACFSFNGNKVITAGGGGMIVTGDAGLAARARHLVTQAKDDPVEYVHQEIGYNYRLSNLQAAVGCAQLENLNEHVAAKRAIAARYAASFAGIAGIELIDEAPWARSAFWLSTVLVDPEVVPGGSRALLRRLAAKGIQARPLWQPMHRSAAHRDSRPAECPQAERLHALALSLPSSVGLALHEQERVIEAVVAVADV
jgi:perosamine synthetase